MSSSYDDFEIRHFF